MAVGRERKKNKEWKNGENTKLFDFHKLWSQGGPEGVFITMKYK